MESATAQNSPGGEKAGYSASSPPMLSQYTEQQTTVSSSRQSINDFFTDDANVARATLRAHIYTGISSAMVLLFLIVFMLDTMPQYRVKKHWPEIAAAINLATAVFFAVEWVLRFYSFRKPYRYLIQPLTLIDLLGVVPAFVSYNPNENTSFGHVKWLRALQVLRVLRVLRLTQYSVELYVTLRTIRKSLAQILVVMLVIVITLLTACFFMFFAENDSLDVANVQWLRKNHGVVEASPFQNIFYCLYWGFVTVTTVGYGDLTPVSPWGQVVACVTMVMGVFTIVFPTSIISTNFANEWDAFHKAQKLHENRILQHDTDNRKHELVKIWRDANQSYHDTGDGGDNGNSEGGSGGGSGDVDHASGPLEALYPETAGDARSTVMHHDSGRTNSQSHRLLFQEFHDDTKSTPDDELPYMPHSTKMAPFEYQRIMSVAKKVEKDLGIPSVTLSEVSSTSEINQNLVVNAMHSKLYNDAYGCLCERMLMRLMEHGDFDAVDEVASFLQFTSKDAHHLRITEREKKKLSVLEYRLLGFIYEKVSLKINHPSGHLGHNALSPTGHHKHGHLASHLNLHQHGESSTPNVDEASRRPGGGFRHHVRSRLGKAYSRLTFSRTTSRQSIQGYMSLSLANDKIGSGQPAPPRQRPRVARGSQLGNISRPMPLARSNSDEFIDTPPRTPTPAAKPTKEYQKSAGEAADQTRRLASHSSSVAIDVASSSADMSTESDPGPIIDDSDHNDDAADADHEDNDGHDDSDSTPSVHST
ncbi:voltage-gated potassium channel [Martensiomyces pterosporus]|nr:voltage-gated potassium channel [Martensiomyces pterosporus]